MLEFIKKNKNIILSSSIFTGINSNVYCGCKKISGKGNENNKKETTETSKTPETPENPPVDKEFEKEKTELIEKVNKLEEYFKKFIFDEKTFIKTLKDKLKVITKENIGQIKKSFEAKDKELKKIINFDKFLTDNKYGKFLISSCSDLEYDFSFNDLANKEFYNKKTEEIKDKISKLGITKENIRNYRIVNLNYDNVKCYFIVEFDINKKNVLLDYFKDDYNHVLKYNTNYFIFDENNYLKLFIISPSYINQCFNITGTAMVGDKLSKKDHSFFSIFFNDSFEVLNDGNDPFADFFIDKIINKGTKETYYCLRFGKKTFDIIKKEGDNQKFIKCINDNLYYIIYNKTTGKFIDTELKIENCTKYHDGSGITSGEYCFTI